MIIKYPEIYYSDGIRKILHSSPVIPEAPKAPSKPKQPVNPGSYLGNGQGKFIFMMVVCVIGFIYIIFAYDGDSKGLLILLPIIIFLFNFFMYKTEVWDEESHQKKVEEYKKEERVYPERLRQYQEELKTYEQEKQKYDILAERLKSYDSVLSFRKQLFREWESSREFPEILDCEEDETIKKGVAEDYFFNLLQQNGLNAYQNQKIPIGGKYYYPDIIVFHGSIIIDIEIDEPYSGNNGTPIHYLSEKYGIYSSSDEKRNDYFCRNGFEIIRFAEEQIFRNTNDCINFIFQFISSINNSIELCIPEKLIIDKWTKEVAHKWAYQRFRNTYVPYELQKNITNEGERSYEDIRAEYSSQDLKEEYMDDLPF